MKNALLALLLLSALCSCSKQNHENDHHLVGAPIVGGEEIQDDTFKSTVALIRPLGNRKNDQVDGLGFPYCSANLISADKVQTAAHCIISIEDDLLLRRRIRESLAIKFDNPTLPYQYDEEEFLSRNLNQEEVLQLKTYLKEYFRYEAQQTLIHFGNGYLYQGFSFDFIKGKFLVEDITGADPYIDYLFGTLYQDAVFLDDEYRINFSNRFDKVVLNLNISVAGINPVPYMSFEEYEQYIYPGAEVLAVGFGSKFDQKVVDYFDRILKRTESERLEIFNQEVINSQELADLDQKVEALKNYLQSIRYKAEQYGSKSMVTLLIQSIDEHVLIIGHDSNSSRDLRGTCDGDSGGPVFFIIPETGELKQLGVISTGTYCGYGAAISLTLE